LPTTIFFCTSIAYVTTGTTDSILAGGRWSAKSAKKPVVGGRLLSRYPSLPELRPRTKHIALRYHHFREHVRNGKVRINAIDTKEQIAEDIFTKGLPKDAFVYLYTLQTTVCGW